MYSMKTDTVWYWWCALAATNVQSFTQMSVVFHCLDAPAAWNAAADFSTEFWAHTVDYCRMSPACMQLSWCSSDISACVFKSRVSFHVSISNFVSGWLCY